MSSIKLYLMVKPHKECYATKFGWCSDNNFILNGCETLYEVPKLDSVLIANGYTPHGVKDAEYVDIWAEFVATKKDGLFSDSVLEMINPQATSDDASGDPDHQTEETEDGDEDGTATDFVEDEADGEPSDPEANSDTDEDAGVEVSAQEPDAPLTVDGLTFEELVALPMSELRKIGDKYDAKHISKDGLAKEILANANKTEG